MKKTLLLIALLVSNSNIASAKPETSKRKPASGWTQLALDYGQVKNMKMKISDMEDHATNFALALQLCYEASKKDGLTYQNVMLIGYNAGGTVSIVCHSK
jgi:hypothetical protein